MVSPIFLFLRIPGRINRLSFWIGLAGLFLLVTGGNYILRTIGVSMTGFWLSMIFPCLYIYMIYCVFGKRLRDMGHSLWFLTAMFTLEFLAVLLVMMAFGGAEYFSEFSQFSSKAEIDLDVREAIISKYQAKLKANSHLTGPLLMGIPVLVSIYAGLARRKLFSNSTEE